MSSLELREEVSDQEVGGGEGSILEYASIFWLLAQALDWNEVALLDQFLEGLKEEILDEFASMDKPLSFPELLNLSLWIKGEFGDLNDRPYMGEILGQIRSHACNTAMTSDAAGSPSSLFPNRAHAVRGELNHS